MSTIDIRNVKINSINRIIDADFYFPVGTDLFPIVIMSHGYNGYKTDFAGTAQYLAKHGVAVLCHTFCGGSTRDNSGFPTTSMTLYTEAEDLTAILDEVKTWERVDREKIFLFGGSQGGMVTALVAEKRERDIRALILLYPAFCIVDNWNERFPTLDLIPEQEELWDMKLGRDFFTSIHGLEVKNMVGNFSKPILILHGTEDGIVPLSYAKWAEQHYPCVTLEVFEGEGHGFSEVGTHRLEGMLLFFVHNNS